MRVTAKTLNVRSGPGTQFRILSTLAQEAMVRVAESSGEWAWVTPGHGWVHTAYLAAVRRLTAPSGLAEIRRLYGEPGSPAASAGRVLLPAPVKLAWSTALITRAACHIELEALFTEVFAGIHARGHWGLIREWGGLYMVRPKRTNGKEMSTHSWGIAVDLNPATNRQGTKGDMPKELVDAFEAAGFQWGGRWRVPDPMHYQFALHY
jgi:hypothetical protein